MSTLFSWVGDEANLDQRNGRELLRKMTLVRDQYKNILDEAVRCFDRDVSAMQKALPELALVRRASPARQAAAMLRTMDAFQPSVDVYADHRALMYMSESSSMFRHVSRVFEAVVYRPARSQ